MDSRPQLHVIVWRRARGRAGSVTKAEWRQYVLTAYRTKAERTALYAIMEAHEKQVRTGVLLATHRYRLLI